MVDIRAISESELAEFRRVYNQSLGRDESMATIRGHYSEHPELLIGAFENGSMVGFAFGADGKHQGIVLRGIGVAESHRREGIGSALLDAFENAVLSCGFEYASLGSAGGYVDEFYVANGYEPESILLRFDSEADAEEYRDLDYEIIRERVDEGTVKWYVAVDGFDPDFLTEVREAFDDPEAIHIMETELDAETAESELDAETAESELDAETADR